MGREPDVRSPGPAHALDSAGWGTLWFGVLGGMLAWLAHLTVSYALVPYVCATDREGVLHLVTAGAALVAAVAAGAGWWSYRRLRAIPPPADGGEWEEGYRFVRAEARARVQSFLGVFGALLSGFFLALILVEGLQVLLFADPCGAIRTEDPPIIRVDSEAWLALRPGWGVDGCGR